MAKIRLAYLGGGSSRAAGTMASFIAHGSEFEGSEVVLIDQRPDELEIVRTLTEKMARSAGVDLTVSATTNRRDALEAVAPCSAASGPATSRCACRTS
jgi:6-phospho-beta-glucosidase